MPIRELPFFVSPVGRGLSQIQFYYLHPVSRQKTLNTGVMSDSPLGVTLLELLTTARTIEAENQDLSNRCQEQEKEIAMLKGQVSGLERQVEGHKARKKGE